MLRLNLVHEYFGSGHQIITMFASTFSRDKDFGIAVVATRFSLCILDDCEIFGVLTHAFHFSLGGGWATLGRSE